MRYEIPERPIKLVVVDEPVSPSGELYETLGAGQPLRGLPEAVRLGARAAFAETAKERRARRQKLIGSLNGTQQRIYDALTDQAQLARAIASAANLADETDNGGNIRRELGNLITMGLAENMSRKGYRRTG